ncbi:uncharacterized protein [Euphorbia lathyris]|uniref:uncharacterized protein isoform X2 n=1 Tax=Euphorbia lathyris TaxID=212925 RepID=UPI0033132871
MGFSSLPLPLLLFSFTFFFLHSTGLTGVDLGNPVTDIDPSSLTRHLPIHGSKDVFYCERVKVSGRSRLEIGNYASVFRVTLAPLAIPERLHSKIQVCFHRNVSRVDCRCEKDEWRTIQKGVWSTVMSPYEERYIDVKFIGPVPGSVKVSVKEEMQQWRLVCLAVGFLLLLLAPIVCHWVPFYYSTSMAIGIFLVVIILLFQGMKLLPTGRKNVFYLSIYGSVLGAGTYILHHISVLVNSILINFGLSEDMHNPVYVLVLVMIVLAGAALGYWIVRKFVISKDGSVDVGVAQFVKWAIRIIATTFILQSTIDTPFAIASLISMNSLCYLLNTFRWSHPEHGSHHSGGIWCKQGKQLVVNNRAEFLSRSPKNTSGGRMWSSPMSSSSWPNSPVKGTRGQQDCVSTFHNTPRRKKFTKTEWEDFTRESTRQAVAEWASSPEVASWMIENADRIRLLRSDRSSDGTVGSESDSSDETVARKGFSLFSW